MHAEPLHQPSERTCWATHVHAGRHMYMYMLGDTCTCTCWATHVHANKWQSHSCSSRSFTTLRHNPLYETRFQFACGFRRIQCAIETVLCMPTHMWKNMHLCALTQRILHTCKYTLHTHTTSVQHTNQGRHTIRYQNNLVSSHSSKGICPSCGLLTRTAPNPQ